MSSAIVVFQVLLGILMAPRGKYLHSRPVIPSSASEQHIVLPLANTLPRIPLLPSSAAKCASTHHSLLVGLLPDIVYKLSLETYFWLLYVLFLLSFFSTQMQDLGKQHLPVFSQVAACLQHI